MICPLPFLVSASATLLLFVSESLLAQPEPDEEAENDDAYGVKYGKVWKCRFHGSV